MSQNTFILHSAYPPSGDQPEALARLIGNIQSGVTHQTFQRNGFRQNVHDGKYDPSPATPNLNSCAQ